MANYNLYFNYHFFKLYCLNIIKQDIQNNSYEYTKIKHIMGIEERCALVRSCKWVDEVI